MNESNHREPKRVFISFFGYTRLNTEFVIKEFGVITSPLEQLGVIGVFNPPCDWEKLTPACKKSFLESKAQHGILWDVGVFDFKTQKNILERYLKDAKYIYVATFDDKVNLLKVIGNFYASRVVSLDTYSFSQSKFRGTDCVYHQNPEDNVCAYDWAKAMYKWFHEEKTVRIE